MSSKETKYTDVFIENLEAYNAGYDLIVNQGGQGSSKTISILQLLFLLWKTIANLRITVASYALPHLRAGALSDMKRIFQDNGLNEFDYFHASEFTFRHPNGSYIEFVGVEGNEAKATGPRRDILYVNEANKRIKYDVFELMNARTHVCTFIDFNPSAKFWYHEKIQNSFDHKLIVSTYLNNPYLPERELRNLLSKRDKPGFENWWKVYGLGQLGQLEGAILKNWIFGKFNDSLPYGYGIDFGVKHYDAMVKCAVDKINKKIYWKEEIFINGLSTSKLVEVVKSRNVGNKLIVGDSAALRTINDMKEAGLNIKSVKKAHILDDIKLLTGYDLIIDENSLNLADNLNNWIWLDKKGEIPIDEYDDAIDAGRYYTCPLLRPNPVKGQKLLSRS